MTMSETAPTDRKPILVVYHANCPDGAASAWAAWKRFGEEAEYRAMNYGEPAPSDEEVSGRDVFYVDFSAPRNDLLRIRAAAKGLTILDHHTTAQAELEGLPYAKFDMNHSGAYLAWQFLAGATSTPDVIRYVEDRDLWRWALPDSKAISAAISSFGVTEDFRRFDLVHEALSSPSGYDRLVAVGMAVLAYQDETVKVALTRRMMGILGGHVVPIVNTTTLFSEVAGELAAGYPFGVAWFVRADGKIQVSLRVREGDFDVSALAKRYGGGGHAKAAGFESDLPWRELFGVVKTG